MGSEGGVRDILTLENRQARGNQYIVSQRMIICCCDALKGIISLISTKALRIIHKIVNLYVKYCDLCCICVVLIS